MASACTGWGISSAQISSPGIDISPHSAGMLPEGHRMLPFKMQWIFHSLMLSVCQTDSLCTSGILVYAAKFRFLCLGSLWLWSCLPGRHLPGRLQVWSTPRQSSTGPRSTGLEVSCCSFVLGVHFACKL